jgi:hypothetical protein
MEIWSSVYTHVLMLASQFDKCPHVIFNADNRGKPVEEEGRALCTVFVILLQFEIILK